jgi:hypothetical protein
MFGEALEHGARKQRKSTDSGVFGNPTLIAVALRVGHPGV